MKANFEKGKFHRLPKIIIPLLVVLILAAGGFFWWQNREITGSSEDYIIKETDQGKIVENKKAGLTFEVPEGWEIEKLDVEGGVISMSSPDTEAEQKNDQVVLPLQKGCLIHAEIVYQETSLEKIKEEVQYTHSLMGKRYDEFEEITVSNITALKNNFDTQDSGPGVGVYIPKKDKVYSFYLFGTDETQEDCVRKFTQFLATTLIQ